MKILWLSHLLPFPSQGGGVLQRSANLIKTVANAHDVTLLAFNQKNILRMFNPDVNVSLSAALEEINNYCKIVKVVDIECDTKYAGKFRLALSSLFSLTPYSIRWLTSDVYKKLLNELLTDNSYDMIWFDTISLVQYNLTTKIDNSFTILNHHNIESDMMFRRAGKEKNILKKIYYLIEAYKLKNYERNKVCNFDINVTCSPLDSKRIEHISPGIVTRVIPNGVDTKFFLPNSTVIADPYSLVFIGGMSWYPNREAMLFFARQIWPLLKERIPSIKMNVVGECPPQELLELAKLDSNFHVHGFVDDVKKYFNEAGIYVCPISDGGGTKLKILDALAMGKPIVANPVACEGIDVINGKNVSFAEKPEDYVNKICELADNPTMRIEMGRNNRQLILDKYSYDVIGRDLLELIETKINNK